MTILRTRGNNREVVVVVFLIEPGLMLREGRHSSGFCYSIAVKGSESWSIWQGCVGVDDIKGANVH